MYVKSIFVTVNKRAQADVLQFQKCYFHVKRIKTAVSKTTELYEHFTNILKHCFPI